MDFSKLLYSPLADATQPVPVPQSSVGQLQPAQMAPVQGPADFNSVINNPMQGVMTAKPPTTPEEVAQRKSQWSQVLDAFQKDPNLQATLLYMGTQMMQPMQRGQTTGGHIGQAIQSGMGFLAGREELDRKRGMEDKRFELETKQAESQIKGRDTQTEAQQYELDEKRKTEDLRLRKVNLDIQKAEDEIANIADERSLRVVQRRIALMNEEIKTVEASEFMAPQAAQLREKARQLEVRAKEAEINLRNAQARNVGVTPPDATDKMAEAKFKDPAWRAKQNVPPGAGDETYRRLAREEAAKEARTYSTSQGAAVQSANQYEALYKRENKPLPGETPEQYDARVAKAVRLHMDKAAELYARTEYELTPDMQSRLQGANPYAGGVNAPLAPPDPKDRVPGQKYSNARGQVMTWTGTEWRP